MARVQYLRLRLTHTRRGHRPTSRPARRRLTRRPLALYAQTGGPVVPRIASVMLLAALAAPSTAVAADPVLEWIGVMNDVVMASATSPLVTARNAGLVSASVFDAVNGIEGRYRPLRVGRYRGTHASARAAAAQAAYAMLLHLYPLQRSTLDTRLASSLASIASGPEADRAREIANGRVYGQFVADAIFLQRSDDGFAPNPAPPFVGVDAVGFWRPT